VSCCVAPNCGWDRIESDVLESAVESAGSSSVVVLAGSQPPELSGAGSYRCLELAGGRFIRSAPPRDGSTVHIPLDELQGRVEQTLRDAGATADAAAVVARVLVDAERRGHQSHGVSLLPTYLRRIAAGGIVVAAEPELTVLTPSTASVDAGGGLGQLGMDVAAEWCAKAAAEHGLASVAVHENNHVGMLAAYRHAFQRHQVVGLLLNTSGPSVAAPGAQHATLGSNAVCLVTPVEPDREPFCVDMATGVVAAGKIRTAATLGQPIPDGWLQDAEGRPSTDPADFDAGGSIPLFGGYKGLGISLIAEIMAGALAGGRVSPDVAKQRKRPAQVMRCSQLLIGVAAGHFDVTGRRSAPHELVDRLRQAVFEGYHSSPGRPWFPDQLEEDNSERADLYGVPVALSLLDELGWERA
jgi:LDH2 family malate/lactate/ureidoglycolate dehydrogenase